MAGLTREVAGVVRVSAPSTRRPSTAAAASAALSRRRRARPRWLPAPPRSCCSPTWPTRPATRCTSASATGRSAIASCSISRPPTAPSSDVTGSAGARLSRHENRDCGRGRHARPARHSRAGRARPRRPSAQPQQPALPGRPGHRAGLAAALDGCAVVVDASNASAPRRAAQVLVEGSRRLLAAEQRPGSAITWASRSSAVSASRWATTGSRPSRSR